MEVQRRWEDLHIDCLVNVFGKVCVASLACGVPFVCKSWFRATLDPLRSILNRFVGSPTEFFSFYAEDNTVPTVRGRPILQIQYEIKMCKCSTTGFIEFVINRSKGKVTTLKLLKWCTKEALMFVADSDSCPGFKSLSLAENLLDDNSRIFPELVCKWKILEELYLEGEFNLEKIFEQISINCKNFCALGLLGWPCIDELKLIVKFLPNIKYFTLRNCDQLSWDDIVAIL